MPEEPHRSEETVAKLRQVDVHLSQGISMTDAIRHVGVRGVAYDRWQRENERSTV